MSDLIKVPTVNEVLGKKLPEKKFSAGSIVATVWKNEHIVDDVKSYYFTVSFERKYKDKSGVWKSTSSLRVNDLPKAVLVLQKAYEYLALKSEDEY